MSNYGTRPNPAAIWRQLDSMLASSNSNTVVMTRQMYDIIRGDATGDIADHEYKDRLIAQKMNQVSDLSRLLECGYFSAQHLYKKEPFEFNFAANKRERERLVGVLRETATKRDLVKHDLVKIGTIVSAILYEEHQSNLNVEIMREITGEEHGR